MGSQDPIVGLEPIENDTYYVNPYFSREGKTLGWGAGVLISSRELYTGDDTNDPLEDEAGYYPTGHIRFGSLSKFYISAHAWEGVPLYSGGGMILLGAGGRPVSALELYGGYCSEGPYENESFVARVTLDINRSWTLMTTVRFPTDFSNEFGAFDDKEYGASVGLSYRLTSMR